jgi:hypothetical protein
MNNRSLTLMQHHDAEIDAGAAAELDASLSPEDAAILEGLEQLGDVVRVHADHRAQGADDIADDLFAQIDAEDRKHARVAELRVIEGGAGQAEPLVSEPAQSASRVSSQIAAKDTPKPGDGRAGRIFLALSLAAAAALGARAVLTADYTAPAQTVAALVESAVAPAVDLPEPLTADAELSAAAIESVDFGSQNGAIFMVSAGAETTPVVWLSDDPQSGDRMEPL